MCVCCECCVLWGRGCVSVVSVVCCQVEVSVFGLITRPEESYRVWCVWVWSWSIDNEDVLAHWGCAGRPTGGCYALEVRNEKQPIGDRVFSGLIVHFRRADQRPSGVGHSGSAGMLRGWSVSAQTGRPNRFMSVTLGDSDDEATFSEFKFYFTGTELSFWTVCAWMGGHSSFKNM